MIHKSYIEQVDEKMKEIRAHLLGMDVPFHHFLPMRGMHMTQDEQLLWLTDRITFMLLSKAPWASVQETERTRRWLYGILRYIYCFSPRSDRTFDSVQSLVKLAPESRQILFLTLGKCFHPLLEPEPPTTFALLEHVVVELVGEPKLAKRAMNIQNALQQGP